jgi:hypothetical protein
VRRHLSAALLAFIALPGVAQSGAAPVRALKTAGVKGDGNVDDLPAIQQAIDEAPAGSTLLGERGKVYRCLRPLDIKQGVTLDLQGAMLRLHLNGGSWTGVRLRSGATLRNGAVETVSSGEPGQQGGIHAAVTIGALYGESVGVDAVSPHEGATGWRLSDLTLSTSRAGRPVCQIIGACSGTIEDIVIPDGPHSGIHLDWGTVGKIDAGDVPRSRAAFDAGLAYTTHPGDISIRRVSIGVLTHQASHGIRLSGVHRVIVESVRVKSVAFAGFYHTAGDFGYELAATDVKTQRHQGIALRNVVIEDARNGWGFFADCEADNVARAASHGYQPLLAPIQPIGLQATECLTKASGLAGVNAGWRLQKLAGARLVRCSASGHRQGALVETGCDRLLIQGGEWSSNRECGIFVGHGGDPPEDVEIDGVIAHGNGADSAWPAAAGVACGATRRPFIARSNLGAQDETQQRYGLSLDPTGTVAATVLDNHVMGCAGTVAWLLGAANSYSTLWLFKGNVGPTSLATPHRGPDILPVDADSERPSATPRRFLARRKSLINGTVPAAGRWVAGDVIEYSDPVTPGVRGTRCIESGSPGRWAPVRADRPS